MLELILSVSSVLGILGTLLFFGYGIVQVAALKRYKALAEGNRITAADLQQEIEKLKQHKAVCEFLAKNPGKTLEDLALHFVKREPLEDQHILLCETNHLEGAECSTTFASFLREANRLPVSTKFVVKDIPTKIYFMGTGAEALAAWINTYKGHTWKGHSNTNWKLYMIAEKKS
jgi:hypothetical protein